MLSYKILMYNFDVKNELYYIWKFICIFYFIVIGDLKYLKYCIYFMYEF